MSRVDRILEAGSRVATITCGAGCREDLLQRYADALADALSAPALLVWMVDSPQEGPSLTLGVGPALLRLGEETPALGEAQIERILSTRAPIFSNAPRIECCRTERERACVEGGEIASFVGLPLLVSDSCIGVVAFFLRERADAQLVRQLALASSSIAPRLQCERIGKDLKSSEEILDKLFSTTYFTLALLDRDMNFLRVNRAYADAGGHPPEFFVGKSHFALYPHEENEAIFRKVMETGETHAVWAKPFEYPDQPERGVTYWDWTLHAVRNVRGEIDGLLFLLIDVTVQKRLEESTRKNDRLLQEMGKLARIGGWEQDLRTGDIFWTKEIYRIYGIEEVPPIEDGISFFAPESRNIIASAFHRLVTLGEPYDLELPFISATGEHLWVRTLGQAEHEGGEVVRVHGSFQDITEQKRLEDQSRRLERQLQHGRSMSALNQLVGGVAHDFNNLLATILGYVDLLESSLVDDEKLAGYCQQIASAGRRGVKLTRRMISLSATSQANAAPCDINATLRGDRVLIERSVTSKISLELDLFEPLWMVSIDEDDFRDVILNLAMNAAQAMDRDQQSSSIAIATRNVVLPATQGGPEASGEWVELTFSDSGRGMDESTRQRVFEPFFTTREAGTGLGLSQAYSFMQRSHGSIHVESEPGQGTRFVLRFPRCEGEAPAAEEEAPRLRSGDGGGGTILLVDDDVALRKLYATLLAREGYRILEAGDGVDALAILDTEEVDLLVSDVIMPHMDGHVLAERVRQDWPKVKIQLTSGSAGRPQPGEVNGDLYDDLLRKPVAPSAFLMRIRRLLSE
ncbi:MAG: PAS domain-containing protein [Myxococcales bacterium]|nr:PAS domain-containing protein [Myxococcales bacterium]